MKLFSPIFKVTLGIVLLTLSLLLMADLLGFIPKEEKGILEGRKKFSESMAIQFSYAVTSGNIDLVKATLTTIVKRDDEIISGALRTSDGKILAVAGNHEKYWQEFSQNKSSSDFVQVPVFNQKVQWGTVEITFAPISSGFHYLGFGQTFIYLMAYIGIGGFLAYWLYIKRTLRELDPRGVIPERVKSAFNSLAEGLMIMDEKCQIILANTSFAEKIGYSADDLIGKKASQISWQAGDRKGDEKARYPWETTLQYNVQQTGIALRYKSPRNGIRTFMVNTSPITDANGGIRGVMATFDDLTDLEHKQIELRQTINQLELSREELREKTVELEYLATRDALTGCLNRRAFFEKFESLYQNAIDNQQPIACIMTDIDHFKIINDNYGHATGDKVIQQVAAELKVNARPEDIVGRYGGEEFCILLPNTDMSDAVSIAERLRTNLKNSSRLKFQLSLRVTASFGVAVITDETRSPAALLEQADKALYIAKESGRNRVVAWKNEIAEKSDSITGEPVNLVNTQLSDSKNTDSTLEEILLAGADANQIQQLQSRISDLEEELSYSQKAVSENSGQDALTGLPNRMLFYDRINQALDRGQRFDRMAAVAVMEIDMFQRINNALGTIVGDHLLKISADRIKEELRQTDSVTILGEKTLGHTISRTGANEFGVLLTDIKDTDEITWIIKRLLDKLSETIEIDGHEIFSTCSAGISLFPHDADNAATLLDSASAARYQAKRSPGKNNLQFYSADINQEAYRHLWIESQLAMALKSGELYLDYQPKVNLDSGEITSMEALLRWHNHKIGYIPPAEFIPIAERTGLIEEIGHWVIRTACEQVKAWVADGIHDVRVAVNLSALEFHQANLCKNITDAIEKSNISPELLELEITETAIMENIHGAVKIIKQLHDIGIRFAVDDFGTGYSSLAYLKHLPVNTLKIDRSFLGDTVPDEQDALIIGAIVAMAHSMNMSVVAEGVETEAQMRFLKQQRCDEIQGYLVSKPVSASETTDILLKYNNKTGRIIHKEGVA